jgi:O-antigen/teichoic acid export membrane protein
VALLSPEGPRETSLGRAAAKGGLVLSVVSVIENGMQFVRSMVLARILTPGDFGLMGMALVAMQAGDALSQTGFQRALMRKKKGEAGEFLDTVWTISVLRGLALAALLFLSAPAIASFFSAPETIPILRTLSVVFILYGLHNPVYHLVERDLDFLRLSVPRLAATLADLGLSVTLAIVQRNVWAMVWGYLLSRVIFLAGSFMIAPYRPRLSIRRDLAVDLHRYGKHVSRTLAVEYVMMQLDKVIIGRSLGPTAFGLYSFAWRLASLPALGASTVVNIVAFPLFTWVQDDLARFRVGFLRALGLMAAATIPFSAGLWLVSSELVEVVLGGKWSGTIPPLRVLCLAGACVALFNLISNIVASVGRPEISARGVYVFFAMVAVPLYPAVRTWGLLGGAWCVSIAAFVTLIFLLRAGARESQCGVVDLVRVLAAPLIASAFMAGVILGGRTLLSGGPSWTSLILEILSGAGVYVLMTVALDSVFKGGLVPSLRSALKVA